MLFVNKGMLFVNKGMLLQNKGMLLVCQYDTPKVILFSPKVILIINVKTSYYGIGIEFDKEHQRRHSGHVGQVLR